MLQHFTITEAAVIPDNTGEGSRGTRQGSSLRHLWPKGQPLPLHSTGEQRGHCSHTESPSAQAQALPSTAMALLPSAATHTPQRATECHKSYRPPLTWPERAKILSWSLCITATLTACQVSSDWSHPHWMSGFTTTLPQQLIFSLSSKAEIGFKLIWETRISENSSQNTNNTPKPWHKYILKPLWNSLLEDTVVNTIFISD